MSDRAYAKAQAQQKTLIGLSPKSSLLQRTCACGQHTLAGGECEACRNERLASHRSQGAFGSLSASTLSQGTSSAQENSRSLNTVVDGASHFGHDFSRIPIHSMQTAVPQTKLEINQPGDVYEQEADQIAEQVMRMTDPEGLVSDNEGEAKNSLMRQQAVPSRAKTATRSPDFSPVVHDILNSGGGQPLESTTRAFMEPRFGHDFSKVRVHTDKRAAGSALSLNALAYTVGHQVVFGAGHYTPETAEGKKLLAHELAHVVQQQASPVGLACKEASGHSTEEKTSGYKPEANVPRGGSEMTIDEPNHVIKYRVYGFDIGSSDVGKLGIKEALDGLPYTLEGVNIRQVLITGLASESRLKGKDAYTYGLERAEAVQSYLAGKVAPSFVVTTKSEGSASAPPVSASPQQKAFARAVIIEIKYTGSLPDLVRLAGGHLELKPGPVDIGKIKQEVERKLTQQARERRELPVFKQPSSTGYTYRYDHVIGRESETGGKFMSDTDSVLLALKLDPNAFFPFNVEGSSGEKSIVLGGKYDLVNKPGRLFPLPPGRHPIEVSEVTENSFTFKSLPGHFDTPGSTITFIIYEDTNGNIHIEHDGVALPAKDPSVKYLIAPDLAKLTWDEQAANLSKWLETRGRVKPFSGVTP